MEELFASNQNPPAVKTDRVSVGCVGKLCRSASSAKGLIIFVIVVCALVGSFYAYRYVHKKVSKMLANHIQENVLYVTDYLQQRIDNLEEDLEKSKNIYVYNLQAAVANSDMVKIKENFEKDVKALNKEIEEARKKIQKLEKSNVKKDFAELYLNSLKLKKDNMLKNHEKELQNAADSINAALNEIVKKEKIPAIFKVDAVAYSSGNVIDVTPEVVKLLKK